MQPTPDHPRITIAAVGAGTITQSVHLPALARLAGRFALTAVSDLSPARSARVAEAAGAGVHAVPDYSELLADPDLDAVLLATPGTHAAAARAALRSCRSCSSPCTRRGSG